MTPGAPSRPIPPFRAGRTIALSPRAARILFANGAAGVAVLIWLLPSPWGGLVPVALLAQLVWFRHSLLATVVGLSTGAVIGAAVGTLLGMDDWRRAAVALLLLLLPAMAAWPSRDDSARR